MVGGRVLDRKYGGIRCQHHRTPTRRRTKDEGDLSSNSAADEIGEVTFFCAS